MKPLTVLLVAMGFAAGVAAGLSGPVAKASAGLARMISSDTAVAGPLVRVTAASVVLSHEGVQPSDIRWIARDLNSKQVICAPDNAAAKAAEPVIQHL